MKIKNIEVNGEVYKLPQKTSDLTNDSEFQTKEEVEQLINTSKVNISIVGNKLVITNVELSQNNAYDRRY